MLSTLTRGSLSQIKISWRILKIVQLEENSQDDLIDDEFQEEETTPSEEIADFIRKQGKIYGGGQIRLQEKVKLCTRINSLNSEQRQIDI